MVTQRPLPLLSLCLLGATLLVSCRSGLLPGTTPPKRLAVPPEMRHERPKARDLKEQEKVQGARVAHPGHYTLRLAENGRVWEMELPEDTGGYEFRIPLSGNDGPAEMLTAADQELLGELASAGAGADGGSGNVVSAKATAHRKSYLGSLARVNELYAARKYELALIDVVALEKEYPSDARLLSMKGSLYLKLGKPKLARDAWQKALVQNPNDQGLAEALRELESQEGQ